MNVCIIGGSGAVGGALASRLSADGHTVTATHHRRSPRDIAGVSWRALDATSDEAMARFFGETGPLDWIINTVGILHTDGMMPEKTVRRFSPESLTTAITINTLPTLLIGKHARAVLSQSEAPILASLSARVGSISDNGLGGWYSYRCSKAALNMAIRTLSIEWRHALPKASVAALHPGTVESELSMPFVGKNHAPVTPETAADRLLPVIAGLTPENSGQLWDWNGTVINW